MSKPVILIADDQAHIRQSLTLLLEGEGFAVREATSPAEVMRALDHGVISLLLMDMNYARDTTSGQEGLALIKDIRQAEHELPILVMTAWANISLSVSAIKAGANDFIEKPWNNARLLSLITNQLSLAEAQQTNRALAEITKHSDAPSTLIADSPAMRPVMQLIERTAASDANILLTGESGVGKSLFAGLIHDLSERHQGPLVKVNMGALSDNLFESELFGHQKGAFTDAKSSRIGRFEMANNGSLFLDEIANIPFALQGKLLRVLESGEYEALGSSTTKQANVRLISASNVDFDEEVAAGRFRQDLLYRLNTITIDIPPLRQRREDILPLAESFLAQFSRKYRRNGLTFSDKACQRMQQHDWPGNVRELSHCIERAVLVTGSQHIEPQDLGIAVASNTSDISHMTLEEAEKFLIKQALSTCEGNILMAAEKLGISRAALYRRLEKYDDVQLAERQLSEDSH